ncbi:MAG: hypothetical protein ACI90V_003847 [Bacillariaceae sp.]|jgi:hypothetical protein
MDLLVCPGLPDQNANFRLVLGLLPGFKSIIIREYGWVGGWVGLKTTTNYFLLHHLRSFQVGEERKTERKKIRNKLETSNWYLAVLCSYHVMIHG